ncbi:DUF5362 family protein [Oceanobacillus neutriphilus]|uniref:DUF5362 domain-containing protein n=1 Tax=Oceanobacillus neutriphilus TaxID=531815 RepID=A0ABQ2P0H6_9BACI|nr:DUF5362 family protein [Oceanobacillus neutriphilus]GGP15052.1 hypothetical protein GCM10011346_41510 [Oceanobacillus neutriphilus]
MEYIEKDNLKRIATWGKLVGITSIIFSSLTIIAIFFWSLGGVIGGVTGIITGYLFYQTGVEASNIIDSDDLTAGNVNELLNKYGNLLLIMGILTIISLVLIIPSIIILLTM